ncbi:MAG: hypothetical protein AAGJ10_13815 [Bacteroidota bacterium]
MRALIYLYLLRRSIGKLRQLFGGTTSIIVASSGEVRISTGLSERDADLLADAAFRYSQQKKAAPSTCMKGRRQNTHN